MCGALGVDVWGRRGEAGCVGQHWGALGWQPHRSPPPQHMAAVRRLQAEVEAALRMEGERKEWGEGLQCDPQVGPISGTQKWDP